LRLLSHATANEQINNLEHFRIRPDDSLVTSADVLGFPRQACDRGLLDGNHAVVLQAKRR